MILRRIKAHVENENWFAVGLDFAIVVIGVFIGIQVANWNEFRGEQARGENIKARLVAEFVGLESEYARHVRDVTGWMSNTDQLAQDILTGSIDLTSPEFSERLFENGWRSPSAGSNTVAELISQGDMDLLKSPDLVEKLLQFQTLTERHVRSNEALFAQQRLDNNSLFHVAILATLPPDAQTDEFSDYLDEIASAPDLYVSLMYGSQLLQADLTWHQFSLESACAILQELDEPCRATETLATETIP